MAESKKPEENARLDQVEARLDALSGEVKDAMEEIAEQLEEITQAVTRDNGEREAQQEQQQEPDPGDEADAESEASNGSRLPQLSMPDSVPRPSNAVLIAAGAGTAAAITTVIAAKKMKGSSLPGDAE